jgi:mannose-6-phosphate isomerase-like protein (cupin superfamily)
MNHFQQIMGGIDVLPLLMAIKLKPELWDAQTLRKDRPNNAHKQTQDIWIRYNDPDLVNEPDYTEEHMSVWHPAYFELPQLRPIIFGLMARLEATQLGGILITKIPPKGSVLPHIDKGWHPEYYPLKLYIPLQTNAQCVNRCEDEMVTMKTGDCWYFCNTVEHEVINEGNEDRITLIICLRTE